MSLYPDNQNRANRVRQLSGDCAHIQAQIKANVEDARKEDAKAIKVLNEIATTAGYKTLDAYVEAAAKQLTAEERAAFDKMKTDLEKLDDDMEVSHKVFRGMIAVGLFTHGLRIFTIGFKETQSLMFGLQAVLKAIYCALLGSIETAVKLVSWGRITLSLVSRTGGISTEALNGMKYMKIGGNLLVGVGVLVDGALLIAEAIKGAEQRSDLQKAIKELCAHRFIIKEMEQQSRVILSFKSNAMSFVSTRNSYEMFLKTKKITLEDVANALKEDRDKIETQLKDAMNLITADKIWKMLDSQDTESRVAWRNEDPKLDEILKWIDDHPKGK